MDLVIRDARVVDGSGAPSYRADVGITDGRIAEIRREGDGPRPTAARTLDADGLALSPGFTDMHAHSDLALLRDPDHSAKAAQGVTLEVLGQDGLSYAPADDRTLAEVRRAIAGWNGDGSDIDFDWRTVGGYLDRLDRNFDGQGIAVNAAYLVPQGTVRMLAVGWEDRPATEAELVRMKDLVAQGMTEGAVGMSSGLTYTPGMYANDSELAELCRVVARYDGYYCPHHRSYGAGALAAYEEMVRLTRDAGCALHLAHATMNFGVNEGKAPDLLALLDDALAAGADISLDTYPYTPGCTTLVAMLPSWAGEGGPASVLNRLADDATAERIRHHLEVVGSDGCHGVPIEWDTIEISGTGSPELAGYVGRTVAESARAHGEAPWVTARRLLTEDRLGTTILQHVGHEENVRQIMRHRVHTGGSDGILQGDKPHPRAYGTFPQYLGRYVRELGILSLEECVAHLTSRPAARLRLADRGYVREGYRADLVLFDPGTVAAGSTFDEPRTLPVGIPHVLIDGRFVIEDGRRTSVLAGRAVRGPGRPVRP
ncbi:MULTISPECIES: D-aminoacylase [unclassified Streptomyces]|uniref:N-acyl-D-amino-acid deacylase family protein n=1 Tax=unclassified Streptomyces TaxID=2593676 RepID=UPI0001C1C009|nr:MULTISPECIES: D-aminoacylase [unclassified Streptomyces]AEN12076.1 Amidohydrolase 3 [Streptomyces sp. SirexAA-E]MYR68215.1 amidohydrolase family protein [Streptomyces sp. SID4939]MYS03223.1 amidohydrolase family protein [Streptomyces sp. SID4940]MYT66883.1 amidohydrolase family protein [Streptomyces sp. SID8357]MYT88340.1 amidohydrolase family protein [Streptomyces sp. SID8360]